jgi:death on curing protein
VNQLHTTFVNPDGQPTNTLLESAVQSPVNHKHYTGENDVVTLAGILGFKLIQNHPYGDGNKRTALLSVQTFLNISGKTLEGTDTAGNAQLADAHVAVATGRI